MSLKQGTFDLLDLSDLLINIWSYAEHVYHKASPDPSSCVCEKYLQFCIVAAKKKKKNGRKDILISILWFVI